MPAPKSSYSATQDAPAENFAAVTPNDSTDLTLRARGLYIGTGGTLVVQGNDSADVTFLNVPNGTILPIAVSRVKATGTTCSNIIALW